ncbi:DUF3011 domain-containing protein [Aestuariivirga sp.]|uniref:DUF3011 domain-containing protein n=1 Tax=Aestuariivirga sp. TaxID=2650926 RepID=UPI0039E3B42D
MMRIFSPSSQAKALLCAFALAAFLCGGSGEASAKHKITCSSPNGKYAECFAGAMGWPVLKKQYSGRCIQNQSWGYNAATGVIWVAGGCSGVFADVGQVYAPPPPVPPRYYRNSGVLNGCFGAGCGKKYKDPGIDTRPQFDKNGEPNFDKKGRYIGCHGNGCGVDSPSQGDDEIDTRPQFDKNGEPNFDTKGGYIGCHGVGCDVDTPDDEGGSDN